MEDDRYLRRRPLFWTTPSPEIIGHDIDLIPQILIHLPVKTVFSFLSVSKLWRSVLSDPAFRTAHAALHRSTAPSALLLNITFSPPPTFRTIPLNTADPKFRLHALDYLAAPFVKIWQSCNGLILCSSSSAAVLGVPGSLDGLKWEPVRFPISGESSIRYHVCNPTTRVFVTLDFPNYEYKGFVHALNLAFDPSISPHYRVVCIRVLDMDAESTDDVYMGSSGANSYPFTYLKSMESSSVLNGEQIYEIDMYFSETRAWKPICSFRVYDTICFRFPVFLNGAIHWNCDGYTSLYFDVGNECLKELPMPPPDTALLQTLYFGESRGHLHTIRVGLASQLKFRIFEMREDYLGWRVKYCVNLYSLIPTLWGLGLSFNTSGECNAFAIFDLIREEKEDESRLVIFVSGTVFAYNLKRGTLVDLRTLKLRHNRLILYHGKFVAFRYVPSLAGV